MQAVQVTHLGYYASEREAAHVHDLVALSLDNPSILNFDAEQCDPVTVDSLRGKNRPELQRALGVKPMDKSSRYALKACLGLRALRLQAWAAFPA